MKCFYFYLKFFNVRLKNGKDTLLLPPHHGLAHLATNPEPFPRSDGLFFESRHRKRLEGKENLCWYLKVSQDNLLLQLVDNLG